MNCFMRAAKYLRRKKRKALLLFLLFLAVNGMVMGTWAIRASSRKLAEDLGRNAESRVLLESLKPRKSASGEDAEIRERRKTQESGERANGFDGEDLREIAAMEHVIRVARISEMYGASPQILPVAGKEGSEPLFDICGYDEPEKDGPFADRVYRIVDGRLPENGTEIAINRYLAEANGLQTGDRVSFQSEGQEPMETVVCGLFLSGSEQDQTENVAAVNRTENQIFAAPELVSALSGTDACARAAVYVGDPESLEAVRAALAEHFGDRAAVSVMDNTYQKLRQTIGQTDRVMLLVLWLTVLMGGTAAGLLLAMQTRGRKREIAVLFSLGEPKREICLQMLTEELCLYGLGFAGAWAGLSLVLPAIGERLDYLRENAAALSLSWREGALFFGAGLGGTAVLTVLSVWPYMRKQVREILTEMEE